MSSPAFVIGKLTRIPQLSRTTDGTPVINLTLADNSRRQVEGEWVDGPITFWNIVCFGVQAEHISASPTKGARVSGSAPSAPAPGRPLTGQERSTLEVLAEEIGPSLRWATIQVNNGVAAGNRPTAGRRRAPERRRTHDPCRRGAACPRWSRVRARDHAADQRLASPLRRRGRRR
jgi:single-strand DNA-binding protein